MEIFDQSININPKDDKGETPLHWAAANGHMNVCEFILEHIHMDKNPKDKLRWQTPLHLAVRKGNKTKSNFVVNKNPKDRDDVTSLHLAAENGHIAVCEFILNNVVYKNPRNKTRWTLLHWVAGKGKSIDLQE